MKRLVVAGALIGTLAVPGLARAGSSTDAALALGAFAVFNQILSGTGVFGAARVAAAPAPPVVYTPVPPPPPVVYAPAAPPVVYAPAPAPPVVYAPPPPRRVVYQPAPVVVYAPPPRIVYREPAVVYRPAPRHRHGHDRPYWR